MSSVIHTEMLPIRGRSRELAVVDARVAGLSEGRGSVLLIDGPPGIGKTRLLIEVGMRTEARGGRLLSGAASEHQRAVPFGPLLSATLGADPPVGDAEALRTLGSSGDLRYWVVHELESAITDAARATPLTVAIDDAHLADAGTIVAIRMLMAALVDVPVLWALTARTGSSGAAIRDAVEALASSGTDHVSHLRLSTVNPAAAADIVADILGSKVDDSLLQLTTKAKGNPLLIRELLRGLREDNRIHEAVGRASAIGATLPQRLFATMDHRLDSLDPMTRRLVEVAAVLPERFSVALLARMTDRRPSELAAAITEAVHADLLVGDEKRLRFRHDLVRSAVRATIPESLLRALERESADILLDMGAAPEEVATQLASSADVGDRAAVESLRSAARALARADCSAAADIGLRALELTGPHSDLRAALLSESVELLVRASRFDEAEAMAARALSEELTAQLEADIRLNLSMLPTRWPDQRSAENRRALILPDVTPLTRARNQAWLSSTVMLDGDLAAKPAALEALDQLGCLDDVDTRMLATAVLAAVELATGHGQRASTICDDIVASMAEIGGSSPAGQAVARYCAMVLAALGRLGDAATVVAENRAVAEAERKISTVQLLNMIQAMCDTAAGRFIAARAVFMPSVATVAARGYVIADVVALTHLASAAVYLDDQTLIRDISSAAREVLRTVGNESARMRARYVLALAAWHRDDLDGAVGHLAPVKRLFTLPFWPIDFDNAVLTARLAAGTQDDGVRRLALTALDILERDNPGVPLMTGIARHVRGLLEDDVSLLTEAVHLLGTGERPILHAAALEDLGNVARGMGQGHTAVDGLGRAFDQYSAHGAVSGARRTARSLRELGVVRRTVRRRAKTGWDSLTAAELRVAELVIEGATNVQVAERLSVSPHTINSHLRNAYSKLEINSRAELKALSRGQRPGR
ncbi:ATP-binding protein [Mycobacterium sp. Marseille-P9652]|uniref:ATP-binding protein n=1 Tax=Mycobacterium sp. Marseille-P9652 TaxID=2654950 RepID=UPI0012E73DAA|nr:AAA family ATPase [Mycobacterium sp. Marseille-P9652]